MKKSLLALALFAFVGTAAFAQEGVAKADKKDKKESCSMKAGMAANPSCCMKGGKTASATASASAKPAAKPAVATAKIY